MTIKNESVEIEPSEGMVKKAKSLTVESLTPGSWFVSGGSEPHIVNKLGDDYECDCLAFKFKGMCSHITVVKLFLANNKR